MANIKTSVSLEKSLLDQAESLAHEMKMTRSNLIRLALEDFIRRRESQELFRRINETYQDEPDAEEQERLRKMRQKYRKVIEGEW